VNLDQGERIIEAFSDQPTKSGMYAEFFQTQLYYLGVVSIPGIHKNLVNWDNYGKPLSISERINEKMF